MSPDGRFVAFVSQAVDLTAVPKTNRATTDVFVAHDLVAGTTTLVSVNSAGNAAANSNSSQPSIAASADGTRLAVAFHSDASNLVAGDANGRRDCSCKCTLGPPCWRASDRPVGAAAMAPRSTPS